jgi:hypothetical protein
MRSFLILAGCGVVVLTLASLAATSAGAKQPTAEEQVTVLLKWYHNYLENGKYKQAGHIAEIVYELAPEDPRTIAAIKVSRRQQAEVADKDKVEQKLDKVLNKLEQLEQHVHELETQKVSLEKQIRALQARNERLTRGSQSPHQEPRGSPDRID